MSVLSEQQLQHYQEQGYICPVDVLNETDSLRLRASLEGMEELQGKPMDKLQCNKSYLLFDWADELVHHPVILYAVEQLIGPNILCYMSNLFTKEAHTGSYVSMHQDAAYWGVEADDVVTAWLALSPASAESGVMKVEPGSHKTLLEQTNTYAKDNLLSRGQEIQAHDLNPENQVYMALNPGQMSLHHFKLVHGSDPNSSDERRIGIAIRYVVADAKRIGKPESALLVRGTAGDGFDMEQRAKGRSHKQRHVEHLRAMRKQFQNIFSAEADASFAEKARLTATRYAASGLSYFKEITAK